MPVPYLGEIRLFAGSRIPTGWAACDGTLLVIDGNEPLFSLLGTMYGGDGRKTFALPDLRGRVPIHRGQGPGLSLRTQGLKGGFETIGLTPEELPPHTHNVTAERALGNRTNPAEAFLAQALDAERFRDQGAVAGAMLPGSVTKSGGSEHHENMAPFLTISAMIALSGIYPPRN